MNDILIPAETGLSDKANGEFAPSTQKPKPSRKAPFMRRAVAAVLDWWIPWPPLVLGNPYWIWVAVAYDLFADSFGGSIGKRVMGLRTLSTDDERGCTIGQSFLRNLNKALLRICVLVGFAMPFSWQLILVLTVLFLFALLILGLDLLMMVLHPRGKRLGDYVADTIVTRRSRSLRVEVMAPPAHRSEHKR
jgi:uncharacterized RDD family membrane protein YckC